MSYGVVLKFAIAAAMPEQTYGEPLNTTRTAQQIAPIVIYDLL
jgi:hypothetical protein